MSLENEIRVIGVKAASETGSIRAPAVGGSSAMRSGTAMERGATGPQGPHGPKGDTGATGPAGADGISMTHRWNGTVLEVTSASGTSSADLKGEPGAVAGVKVAGVTHEPDGTGVVDLGDLSGGADLSDAAPADLGTAAAGTSELAARADHVHKMPTAAQVGAATAEEVSALKDDKLDKTATAADSSKLGGKAPEYYLQPRNLLDNSDFTNLVAQASIGGNHGTVAYAADRWILDSGTVSYEAGVGLTLNGTISQKLEFHSTGQTSAFVGMVSGDASISYADGAVTITSGGGVIKWAALYEGSYTAETLPPYVPKGYAAELAECQRYFRKGAQAVTIGILYGSGSLFSLSAPRMRIHPTVTLTEISSQGWGNVAASNYELGWNGDLGSSLYANYIYKSVSDDVGKTVVVFYEMSSDL